MPAERIITIDFGTSTSVVRVKRYQDGKPIGDRLETKPVTFNMGSTVVPTLIQQRDTGENLYFGYDAEIPRRNTVILRNFKIEIEALDPAVRGRARELTADFFRYLYKTYREQSLGGHLGENDDRERTVISYPVKWSEDTKKFMLETAKNAGFPNVEGQDEALAAIQTVTIQSEKQLRDSGYLTAGQPANILLIDMGAGTTDLVLCRHTPGDAARTEILATWPHGAGTLFGGQEVDELLGGYVKGLLPADSAEKVLKRLGADKFKAWKEHDVSPALARDETVNEFSALDNRLEDMELEIDYSIDRRTFEDFAQDYLRGFPELVSGCLNEAGMTGDQVDLVILTGGHSQWYFVREILSGTLDRFGEVGLTKIQADPERVVSIALPQETVALGLAYGPLRAALPKPAPKPEPKLQPAPEPQSIITATPPVLRNPLRSDQILNAPFLLAVEGAFAISGRGIAAYGLVERGQLSIGDTIAIVGMTDSLKTAAVCDMAIGKKRIDCAKPGDEISVLLDIPTKNKNIVQRGQVLAKPGSIHASKSFICDVSLLKEDECGTNPILFSGQRYQFWFRTVGVFGAIILAGTQLITSGHSTKMAVALESPIALEKGLNFDIRYSDCIIASGRVESISWLSI